MHLNIHGHMCFVHFRNQHNKYIYIYTVYQLYLSVYYVYIYTPYIAVV